MKRKLILAALVAFLTIAAPFVALAQDSGPALAGTVVEVQKYGNLTMDLKPKALYDAGFALGDILNVTIAGQTLRIPFCTSYSDVDTGSLVVRDDQAKSLLVVAINMGNIATKYGVKVGDSLGFAMAEKQGYLADYLLRQLKRTNNRADYANDAVFANFRSVNTTGIAPAILFRSSNPADNSVGRAAYADSLVKAVGVKTVINLSDSDAALAGFFAAPDFKSAYYKSLVDSGKVKALDMGVDIAAKDFGDKLAAGLRFLAANKGPYLVHCTEGKDRAGFVCAVLEALMGAGLDGIVADYMTTYDNYYGVKAGSDQYSAIAASNIVASMTTVVCGLPKGSDLKGVDLAKAAEAYLGRIGMSPAEIAAVKARLAGN